jgi:saccharopine dehydrogenase (NAD+, L-lysine-forming)
MAKILVIGCGNVGSVGLHKMAQHPDVFSEIHVVSRTREKCEAVNESIKQRTGGKVSLTIHTGNVGEGDYFARLLREVNPELVVHWGSPYDNLVIMDACLDYGVNYIDTACYENPDEYGFSYAPQLAKDGDWKAKGLFALLGAGFDPGVSNIFSAYARDYIFDTVETIDILDCNGGSKDKKIKFAPNFDPEINLRELILPIKYWKDGQWVEDGKLIDEDAPYFEFDFPEAGTFTPYLMYHEELETIPQHIPGLKRARFWMTFNKNYLTYLRVLYEVGMTRIDEVDYNGTPVVPVKFLKAILPKGKDFNADYVGKTNIGNIISGYKEGQKKVVYIYNVCDHKEAFLETGGNAIGYTTAIPTVTAAKLVLQGKWGGEGVYNTEDESLDAKAFLEEMPKMGLTWQVKELKDLPEALKKEY